MANAYWFLVLFNSVEFKEYRGMRLKTLQCEIYGYGQALVQLDQGKKQAVVLSFLYFFV